MQAQKAPATVQTKESVFMKATDGELLDFFRWLMSQVESEVKTSKRFSSNTKQRIAWMFDQAAQNFVLSKDIVGKLPFGF